MTGTEECSTHTLVTASETKHWTSPTTSKVPVINEMSDLITGTGWGTLLPNIALTISHTLCRIHPVRVEEMIRGKGVSTCIHILGNLLWWDLPDLRPL